MGKEGLVPDAPQAELRYGSKLKDMDQRFHWFHLEFSMLGIYFSHTPKFKLSCPLFMHSGKFGARDKHKSSASSVA